MAPSTMAPLPRGPECGPPCLTGKMRSSIVARVGMNWPVSTAAVTGAQSPDGPLTWMAASGQPVTHSMHPLQK
jgi:hypothetical protein